MRFSQFLGVIFLIACGGGPGGGDGGGQPDLSSVPPDMTLATGDLSNPAVGCAAKKVAATPQCANDCDASLLMPGNQHYCTLQCAKASDCTSLGSGFACSPAIGACTPVCSDNGFCTAMGFARCDLTNKACDTQ